MSYPSIKLLASDAARSVLGSANHRFAYSAYGYDPVRDVTCPQLGFNGFVQDPRAGLYLLGNGYRGYSPVLMRFCSADSLSPFAAGGVNAYVYCEGDPINYIDPRGQSRNSVRINLDFHTPAKRKELISCTPHYDVAFLQATNPRYRGTIEEITATNALNLALQLPDPRITPPHIMVLPSRISLGIQPGSKELITDVANQGKKLAVSAQQLIKQPSIQKLEQYELELEAYSAGSKLLIEHLQNELNRIKSL
ncbi:RHS repeat-associated core domain-containing protein [Pseudomonas mosselii]|uniref:RHS repeat-associated core domain-containing protein n=1 Tax=Pseudomonas mosselii TaxID=78327 RepID=UPI0035A24395